MDNQPQSGSLSVLVASCDAYADAADHFFALFNRYWPNCQYPVYLVNNTLDKEYANVAVINAGNGLDWLGRMRCALRSMPHKYVLLMLEDYFIGRRVDSEAVNEMVKLMTKEELRYYRISNTPPAKNRPYKGISYLHAIAGNVPYGVNLQAAIWDREFLLDLIGDEDGSAWKFEIDRLKVAIDGAAEDLSGCVVDTRNIVDIHNGVIRGKWVPKTIKYFETQDYVISLGKREVLSSAEEFAIKMKSTLSLYTPRRFRRGIKIALSKWGMKFASLH